MRIIRRRTTSKNCSAEKSKARRLGAALVEMAVCFPVLMLVVLGIIEFGRALMVSQLLTSVARESCREAVIDGATNASVNADIKDMIEDMVGCDPDDADIDITVTSRENGTELQDISDAEQRDLIAIRIKVPYESISYMAGRFLNGKFMNGQCAMRKQ